MLTNEQIDRVDRWLIRVNLAAIALGLVILWIY